MRVLLIADKDSETRQQMADLFSSSGYRVKTAKSLVEVLRDIIKKNVEVLLLGSEFGDLLAVEIIPLLKKCNRNLTIILVSDEESLPLLRKVRCEGIFFHALRPVNDYGRNELRLAVECAFGRSRPTPPPEIPTRWFRQAEAR